MEVDKLRSNHVPILKSALEMNVELIASVLAIALIYIPSLSILKTLLVVLVISYGYYLQSHESIDPEFAPVVCLLVSTFLGRMLVNLSVVLISALLRILNMISGIVCVGVSPTHLCNYGEEESRFRTRKGGRRKGSRSPKV